MDLDKVLYGGDYNPEQWLDRLDILEEDIAMMQEAHINTVTLGVFSWSTLEPEEGKYNFGWLDTIMDRLDQAGISVILVGDIYVAINAQYHDYCELFEKWFGNNFDEKIIASAVDFWFEDDDFEGNKVWKYFNEM